MPKIDHRLFLPGFKVDKTVAANPIVMYVSRTTKVECIHCNSRNLRLKDTFHRQIKHESTGMRRCLLRVKARKFHCRHCGRYFNERFPGILKYQRATERLKNQVYQQHLHGMSQKSIANEHYVGTATIERWFHQYYRRDNQEISARHWPRVLGVDEHFFKKGQFATTFCDLQKHRVFDICQGRSQAAILPHISHIPGRERVKVACIDLSVTYRNFIKRYFPNAMIVADRFHVCRLIEHAFMQVCHQIYPMLKYQRGMSKLLRTKPKNLSAKQQIRLQELFEHQLAIKALYDEKQTLNQLVAHKHLNAKQAKKVIPVFLRHIEYLKNAIFEPLIKLGKTLFKWRDEIARMWRFTKNNGITEGFHRKMKLIQRRAYGFRNFENYRLRVRVLCG